MTKLVMMVAMALCLWNGGDAARAQTHTPGGMTVYTGVKPAAADPFPPDRAFAPSTPYPYPPRELPQPAYELPMEIGGSPAPETGKPQTQPPATAEKSEKQEQIDKIERRTGHKVKSWQVLER